MTSGVELVQPVQILTESIAQAKSCKIDLMSLLVKMLQLAMGSEWSIALFVMMLQLVTTQSSKMQLLPMELKLENGAESKVRSQLVF